MQPARGEAEHDVAGRYRAAVDRGAALDRADGKAGEIVVARPIEARHFRRLAADQGAADLAAGRCDAGDHAFRLRHVEPAGREIIEEQERLGALHDEVVDAHRHEIDAHRVVAPRLDRDLELGADAVGGDDEDGIAVARRLQIEERAEAAQSGVGAGPRRRLRQRLQRRDERVARVDVDAGSAIAQGALLIRHEASSRPRARR